MSFSGALGGVSCVPLVILSGEVVPCGDRVRLSLVKLGADIMGWTIDPDMGKRSLGLFITIQGTVVMSTVVPRFGSDRTIGQGTQTPVRRSNDYILGSEKASGVGRPTVKVRGGSGHSAVDVAEDCR